MWWPGKINKDRTVALNTNSEATHYKLIGECSNNNIDWVYDVMAKSSLENFAASLQKRTTLLAYHDHEKIVGFSTSGEFKQEGDKMSAEGGFDVQKNWVYNGVDTDQFYKGVSGGSLLELSIGAQIGKRICGIEECGKEKPSFWQWLFADDDDLEEFCMEHSAGDEYDGVIATNVLEDCKLMEVSSVYSGACPDSQFLDKVCNMAEMIKGVRVSADDIRKSQLYLPEIGAILEAKMAQTPTFMSLPEKVNAKPNSSSGNPEKTGKGDEPVELEERVQEMRNDAAKLSDTIPSDPVKGLEQFIKTAGEWKEELANEQDENIRNKHKVEEYDRVHQGIITEALESGVKARGDDFDTETWRGMLEKASFKEIAEYKTQWDKEHEGNLPEDGKNIKDPDGKKKEGNEPEPGEYDGTFSLPGASAWV